MDLIRKIDWFYKLAQEMGAPSSVCVSVIKNILSRVSGKQEISDEDKSKLTNDLLEMFKDHPASHIDASWSMCLAHAIDQINSASGGAETPEIKEFYRGLCRMLLATWDSLERAGHKSHVDKPVLFN